jgi:hypothetical protein
MLSNTSANELPKLPHRFTYQAKNPYMQSNSWQEWFKNIFSFSNEYLGNLVLPAQSLSADAENENLEQLALQNQVVINIGFIKTHDDAILDTIQITPEITDTSDISKQYFIVKFLGNGMQYADLLPKIIDDANNLNTTVIAFDYRNVGSSKKAPRKFQDLVTDGIAQIYRLLDLGADPSKILLDGLSLGGAVATMTAKYCHDHGFKVYLWNDRSFAALSKASAGLFAPITHSLSSDLAFTSLESTTWSTMAPLGWEIDVAKAYLTIPAQYKNYMVVARKSAKSYGDGVIHHKASLHYSVKEKEKMTVKTGHKVYAEGFFSGHNMQRSDLISKSDPSKTGQHLFEEFVLNTRLKNK